MAKHVCDSVVAQGTATEVMPIRSLDKISIGANGTRGAITEAVQKRYQDTINGRCEDEFGWLTYVH